MSKFKRTKHTCSAFPQPSGRLHVSPQLGLSSFEVRCEHLTIMDFS